VTAIIALIAVAAIIANVAGVFALPSAPGTITPAQTTSSTSSSVTLVGGQTATSSATTQSPLIQLTSPGTGSPSSGTTVGLFGESLAVGGTYLVVGAPNETSSSLAAAGNVYVFSSSSGTLLRTLTSPAPQKLGSFGWAVAVSGNLAIVGAPGENASGKLAAGHVYAYSLTTGKLVYTLSSPNAQFAGEFGGVLATSGSLLAVGAVNENTTLGFAGRAYVYNATTGSLIGSLKSPNPDFEGEFGSTVYATPSYVIVGAQNETVSGSLGAGNVYVFSASSLALVKTLSSPNAQLNGEFGFSLAGTGSELVVGAPFESVAGDPQIGNAYVYNTASWTLLKTFSGSTAVQEYPPSFGFTVAAGNGLIAAGAPYNNTVVTSTTITGGAVYIYNATTFGLIAGVKAPSVSNGYYSTEFGSTIAIGSGTVIVGDPEAVVLISTSPGYAFPGDAFIFGIGPGTSSTTSSSSAVGSSSTAASVSSSTTVSATSSSSHVTTSSATAASSTTTTASQSSSTGGGPSYLVYVAAAAAIAAVVIIALVMVTRRKGGPGGQGQEPAAPARPPSEFCANCGNPIAPTATFCPNCGAKHSEPDSGSSQGPVQ
jgi:hypothetical protein